MGEAESKQTYKVIEYATGRTVSGGMSFQQAEMRAYMLTDTTGRTHIAIQEVDYNLPYTAEDVM
jgi:hypothetical protein